MRLPWLACYKFPQKGIRYPGGVGEMAVTNTLKTLRRGRCRGALAALALASLSAGCSTERIFGSSPAPDAGSSASASADKPSMAGRLADFFSSKPSPSAGVSSDNLGVNPANLFCPPVDVRQGAATLTIPPGSTDAFNLRYQGTIAEMARECNVSSGVMRMKVGVQGRLLLGPAGGAGALEVPLRFAVVHEGPEPKTIASKFYKVPVTIPEGRPNVPFLHVDEDISFPMPPGADITMYVVYVGFDPLGDKQQPAKKPPPKTAARPAPAR